MQILSLSINSIKTETIKTQIKPFILLINNCKINGPIINYLLSNHLVD